MFSKEVLCPPTQFPLGRQVAPEALAPRAPKDAWLKCGGMGCRKGSGQRAEGRGQAASSTGRCFLPEQARPSQNGCQELPRTPLFQNLDLR